MVKLKIARSCWWSVCRPIMDSCRTWNRKCPWQLAVDDLTCRFSLRSSVACTAYVWISADLISRLLSVPPARLHLIRFLWPDLYRNISRNAFEFWNLTSNVVSVIVSTSVVEMWSRRYRYSDNHVAGRCPWRAQGCTHSRLFQFVCCLSVNWWLRYFQASAPVDLRRFEASVIEFPNAILVRKYAG